MFATQQVDEVEQLADDLASLLVSDADVRLSVVVVEDGRVKEHAHHVVVLLLQLLKSLNQSLPDRCLSAGKVTIALKAYLDLR